MSIHYIFIKHPRTQNKKIYQIKLVNGKVVEKLRVKKPQAVQNKFPIYLVINKNIFLFQTEITKMINNNVIKLDNSTLTPVQKPSFISKFMDRDRLEDFAYMIQPVKDSFTKKKKTDLDIKLLMSYPFVMFIFLPAFIVKMIWWFWKTEDKSWGLEIAKFQFFFVSCCIFFAILYTETIWVGKPYYTMNYNIIGNGNPETLEPLEFGGLFCDASEPSQMGFQDSATPVMESIINLHDHIFFYLIVIMVAVIWIMGIVLKLFATKNTVISHKYLNHGTILEIVWTITPAFILISIAFPSFKLLYLMDEVIDPGLTFKAIGHQWYWSYEFSDYVTENFEAINFDSYMVPTDDLIKGDLRLLEVDNRIILPIHTPIRVIITAADVLHAWAVPSLGVKLDAVPGRLNQTSMYIKREGLYYGQCSELCGVQHGFMPIVIKGVSIQKFFSNLLDCIESYKK